MAYDPVALAMHIARRRHYADGGAPLGPDPFVPGGATDPLGPLPPQTPAQLQAALNGPNPLSASPEAQGARIDSYLSDPRREVDRAAYNRFAEEATPPTIGSSYLGMTPAFVAKLNDTNMSKIGSAPYETLRGIGGLADVIHGAWEGTADPRQPENMDKLIGGTMALTDVGLAAAPFKGAGLGIFGGQLSKTADLEALARAKRMLKKDRYAGEAARQKTGWEQGPGGDWRYEISDDAMRSDRAGFQQHRADMLGIASEQTELASIIKHRAEKMGGDIDGAAADLEYELNRPISSYAITLARQTDKETLLEQAQTLAKAKAVDLPLTVGDVVHHPALFEAYPDLAARPLNEIKGLQALTSHGGYDPTSDALFYSKHSPASMERSTMLHELQHAIQNREGFPIGANAGDMSPEAVDAYMRSAGEVEARNVEARRNMQPGERVAKAPHTTQDIPYHDQIVNHGELQPPTIEGQLTPSMMAKINAYHNSPHEFDRFDLSKIGTGEGNQTYGHGLYAAENPAVSGQGGQYWQQFAEDLPGPEREAALYLKGAGFDRAKAVATLQKSMEDNAALSGRSAADQADFDVWQADRQKAVDLLQSDQHIGPHTYDVEIDAEPHHFLDWDQQLDQQSGYVQRALDNFDYQPMPGETGSNIYRNLNRDRAAASAALRDAGVKGIRYLDQGSRLYGLAEQMTDKYGSREAALKAAEGNLKYAHHSDVRYWEKVVAELQKPETRNYVVFDDKDMGITKRYARGGGMYRMLGGAVDDYEGELPEELHYKRGGGISFTRALQQQLKSKGYDPGKVDGVNGPLTQLALKQFQRDAGLEPTGVGTKETLAALKTPPLPRARPTRFGETPIGALPAGRPSLRDFAMGPPEHGEVATPPEHMYMDQPRGVPDRSAPPPVPGIINDRDREAALVAERIARSNRDWAAQPPLPLGHTPPRRIFTDQPTMTSMPGIGDAVARDPRAPAPNFDAASEPDARTAGLNDEALRDAMHRRALLMSQQAVTERKRGGHVSRPPMAGPLASPLQSGKGFGKQKLGPIPYAAPKPLHRAAKGHVGGLLSEVPGRTDHIPLDVPNGGYVVPADVVSSLGEGNTLAGTTKLNTLFKGFRRRPKPLVASRATGSHRGAAEGGVQAGGDEETIPIMAAGGEYVVAPSDVLQIGEGNMKRGHNILDRFVTSQRKHTIKKLKSLPGPVKEGDR